MKTTAKTSKSIIDDVKDYNNEEILRLEIIESQKSQADMLKWKFIAISAIGVVLTNNKLNDSKIDIIIYLLPLVPFICAYVDLLSYHLMIRIIVIGTYLRKAYKSDTNKMNYEEFVLKTRTSQKVFDFEFFALHGSTFIINLGLFIYGLVILIDPNASNVKDCFPKFLLIISSFFGFFVPIFLVNKFKRKLVSIDKLNIEKVEGDDNTIPQ